MRPLLREFCRADSLILLHPAWYPGLTALDGGSGDREDGGFHPPPPINWELHEVGAARRQGPRTCRGLRLLKQSRKGSPAKYHASGARLMHISVVVRIAALKCKVTHNSASSV
ncbi:hypothetical protein NDU88_005553 [Pleurodeles waltl]|uniref:Uncharacterized protein n=1 Tax=Pleurodeles waltl TaxID=8319 RepID=A0AAV7W851_PLEWA|nr:hypothetical protein NDU88_005553 [Pleurodeles waltl]